jgi:hypothetical protein
MKGKKRLPILSDQRHTYGTPAPGTFIWYFFWENEEEKTLIPLFSRGGRGGMLVLPMKPPQQVVEAEQA